MSTTNHQLITRVLESPCSDDDIQALLDDRETVFWVDWREEDDAIARYCEGILQTGTLTSEFVDVEGNCELYIHYNGRRVTVPIIFSYEDRHITICSLNEILQPDYEVRYLTASRDMDTLAFLPLTANDWSVIERQYGARVGELFYKILPNPNLFTEGLPS